MTFDTFAAWFQRVAWLEVMALLAVAFMLGLLVVWQLQRGDGFDLRSMLANRSRKDGREYWDIAPGKVFQSGAFLLSTWIMILVVQHDKLTEAYLLIYMGVWAGTRGLNQLMAGKMQAPEIETKAKAKVAQVEKE